MNLLDILIIAVIALLIYLIASHKISIASLTARFQGITDQLHQVHGAAIAAATVATPPAPAPAATPAPITAAEIRTIVAEAVKPAPAAGPIFGAATIEALGGQPTGNATADNPVNTTFDVRSLISDSPVLLAGGTKFRTPPGSKTFTFTVREGQSYMLQTGDSAPTTIVVKRPDGTTLAHTEGGGGETGVYFKADFTGDTQVIVTNSGSNNDAGIEAHEVAATPDTGHLAP